LKDAISQTHDYRYFFYETNRGFECHTLEKLYQQQPEFEYYDKGHNIFRDVNQRSVESFNAIQDYSDLTQVDFLNDIMEGDLGSSNVFFNMTTKTMTVVNYDQVSTYNQRKSLGRYPTHNNEIVNKQYTDGTFFTLNTGNDSSKNKTFSYYKKIEANKHRKQILVFGDSSLTCGKVCNAYLPIRHSVGDQEGTDFISGRFLITSIKHSVSNTQFYQTLVIQKDAFEETTQL
jgi:hypothetical protein